MAILTMRQISGKRVIDENPRIFKFCAYFFVGLLMRFLIGWSTLVTFAILFIIYVTTGGWRFLRVVIFTIKRDLRGLFFLIYTTILLKIYKRRGETIINLFQKTVKRYPNKAALVMVDERSFTFKEVDALSNAVANCFYDLGYKKGDVVAIFMENCPEFVILWLGLAKIGVVPALINFNLKMKTLAHCISVSEARALIYGSELSEVVKESKHLLPPGLTLFSKGKQNPTDLDEVLKNYSTEFIQKNVPAKFNDRLLYIFTSGTTGLPKAAVVIHSRYFYMANAVYMFYKMVPEDIIYDTLPLYHTAGGILGIGNCLINGCTVVMRKKFSASKFWTDCIKHDCTVAQYIGEICRYLLVQPSSRNDKGHRVRLVFGNGLRPHIWDEFKTRFNIAQIGEFYGATEGNANIANIDNTKGAVGFQSRILPTVYPVTLIKVNLLTGEPVRNMYGLCIRCEPGEPGELVGKIVSGKPLREFDGYANKEANNKKLVKNVFKRGDCYFLTGDVLEMDEFGYMYFRDRTGDTYRWKGENVSTSEVEGVVSNAAQLSDAVVYGVEVPGTEGRAGMAAIGDPHRVLDLKAFNRALQKMLPPYARPMFIRVLSEVETTGTFKLKKADYRNEGFNPSIIQDDLYYYNSKMSEFEILDGGIYEDILTGRIKF